MTPTELIRVIGPIIFGPRWQTEMAIALEIAPRTVRRWAGSGEHIPPPRVWKELAEMMRHRSEEFARLIPLAEELAGGKGEGDE